MVTKPLCLVAVFLTFGFALSTQAMTRAEYNHAVEIAQADYKSAKGKCNDLSGNTKDVCVKQAKANYTRAKSDAKAAYKGTPHARAEAREDQAEANYKVAKEKCDDLSGNNKDICVQEAKAKLGKAKANK